MLALVTVADVYANGRTIIHAGDGLTQVSGPPDVCKTPSPSGPVPVPYPNTAMDRDLSQGTKRTKIHGHPAALASSRIGTSTGDEAGTAGGGLMSAKTKGKLSFGSSSLNVSFEGKAVVRYGDITQHNGNTYNTVLAAAGEVAVAYGDDPLHETTCSICSEPKSKHALFPNKRVARQARKLREALVEGEFKQVFVKGKPGKLKPLKKGVMIGVLSCQCEARREYAGLAGTRYVDGAYLAGATAFCKAARGLGMTPVVAAPPGPPLSGYTPPARPGGSFGAISDEQWQRALLLLKENQRQSYGGNAPLACAAPKMINKCLADGHKPGVLIEIWVSLRSNSSVSVTPLHALVWHEGGRTSVPRIERIPKFTFDDGEPVPSCATCQVLCTKALCNTGKPPCP